MLGSTKASAPDAGTGCSHSDLGVPSSSSSQTPHLHVSKRWTNLIILGAVLRFSWHTETHCSPGWSAHTAIYVPQKIQGTQPSPCKYVFGCCLWRCHKSILSLFSHPQHLFPFQNIYILLTHSIQLTCHCMVGSCLANIYLASATAFKQPSQVFNDAGNLSHNSARSWHSPSAALPAAGLRELSSLARARAAFLSSTAGIRKCHKQSYKQRYFRHVVGRFYLSTGAQPPQTYIYNLWASAHRCPQFVILVNMTVFSHAGQKHPPELLNYKRKYFCFIFPIILFI